MVEVSVAVFKARYPKFASVADSTVAVFLDEAATDINAGDWIEADKAKAIGLLTAHNLATEGLGTSSDAQFGQFKRLKIGSLELERAAPAATSSRSPYSGTEYGRQFLALMSANFAGPMVI